MKRELMTISVPRAKTRAHYALFAENTPFKPKSEAKKKVYQRKPKFINRDADWL